MKTNAPLRALKTIAITLISVGLIIVVIVPMTWPEWDPFQVALNMSTILDMQVDPSELSAPLHLDRWAWLGVGGAMLSTGVLAGLLALHAAATRFQPATSAVTRQQVDTAGA